MHPDKYGVMAAEAKSLAAQKLVEKSVLGEGDF